MVRNANMEIDGEQETRRRGTRRPEPVVDVQESWFWAPGEGAPLNRRLRYSHTRPGPPPPDDWVRERDADTRTREMIRIDPERQRPTHCRTTKLPTSREPLETRGTWNRNDSGASGPYRPTGASRTIAAAIEMERTDAYH